MLPLVLIGTLILGGDEVADLVITGSLHTSDPDHPRAEALAIRGEFIVAVGTEADVESWVGPQTRVIDAVGRSVLPGFNDAHCHFTAGYGMATPLDVSQATTLEEILDLVKKYAQDNPDLPRIQGGYWDLSDMPADEYPTAASLDACVDDRPVVLWSDGPHAVWANSMALSEAGIQQGLQDPEGSLVVRDPEGRPLGTVLGRSLLFRFRGLLPSLDEFEKGLRRGFEEAARYGVTTVHDSVSPFVLRTLGDFFARGELTLRFHVWVVLQTGSEAARRASDLYARDSWITFGTLKGGIDGMPNLRTASMLEPYADAPHTQGLPIETFDELDALVGDAHGSDLSVALHATGDAGVRTVLDVLEASRSRRERTTHDTIEHAFLIAEEDIERFASLEVIASMQPGFLSQDIAKGYYPRRFGDERLSSIMPMRSLLDAGVTLAFGTDFSLTPLNPMIGLYAATTRKALDGTPEQGFVADECISLQEAITAYTYGSSCAEGKGDIKGLLRPGYLADVVILSEDVFSLEPDELLDVEVETTLVGGRVVYQR